VLPSRQPVRAVMVMLGISRTLLQWSSRYRLLVMEDEPAELVANKWRGKELKGKEVERQRS
jgi:hypothetical protein